MSLRQILVVAVAATTLVAAAAASMTLGAVHVPLSTVIDALTGQAEPGPLKQIVLELRLPRTIEALSVGAALGVAGALLQGALANPLASPDVIGVTGGASFGAMLILLAFPDEIALLPVGALVFGLIASALVFGIANSGVNAGGVGRLILAGIAMTAAFQAATTSLMTAFPDRVQSAIFWLAGGLTTSGWSNLRVVWPYFAVGFLLAIMLTRPLNRLALGDDVAASLGSKPRAIRLTAAVAAALLAASAAAIAGLVTFLGLFIPHVVRMAAGTASQTYVVPTSALAGASLMMAGDTLARTVAAPIELPVGPLMVLIGVPLFLVLLRESGVTALLQRGQPAFVADAPLLDARDVAVAIGGKTILHSADLVVRAGELVAVVGPNGAGKSTFVRAVAGLQSMASGAVRWSGVPVAELRGRQLAALRAFVPQRARVPDGVTVREAVRIGRSPHIKPLGRMTRADHDAVERAIARAGVEQFAERRLTTLSGGELQRVQIAVGLAQEAPVLMADEPTSALDLGATATLAQLLRGLTHEGLAVVLVVHDLSLAAAVADTVVVIANGRSVATGPPGEVLVRDRLADVWHVDAALETRPDGHTALHVAWLGARDRAGAAVEASRQPDEPSDERTSPQ